MSLSFFLWQKPFILTGSLLLLSLAKYFVLRIKHEIIFYFLIFFLSGFIEISMVNLTHAWAYAIPQIFNIPLFMPFLWGLVGVTLLTFYTVITKK